jgi:hypothetical protein
MKSILRKLKARTKDKLYEGINFALNSTSLEHIKHWLEYCGYIANATANVAYAHHKSNGNVSDE